MSEDGIQDIFLHILSEIAKININTSLRTLTQGEYLLLSIIKKNGDYLENRDKSITVSRIAERLEISTAAVSRTLRHLEENGYLERITSTSNRRHTYVILTEVGNRVLREESEHIGNLAKRIFKRMGSEKMNELKNLSLDLHHILLEEISGTSGDSALPQTAKVNS